MDVTTDEAPSPLPLPTPEPVESPPKPCCARIVDAHASGWCILPSDHEGACERGPVSEGPWLPPVDRKLMSRFREDVSLKWHHTRARRIQWLVKWGLPVDPDA